MRLVGDMILKIAVTSLLGVFNSSPDPRFRKKETITNKVIHHLDRVAGYDKKGIWFQATIDNLKL